MEDTMALKGLKELLKKVREDAALTEEQVEDELNKILPEAWIPKSKFNELTEAEKLAKSQLEQTNKQLEELKKGSTLTEEQKKQLETLKTQLEEQKKTHETEVKKLRMNHAIETELSKAKAKNLKAARALLDESKIVLGEDGTIAGLKEQLEAMQKDNAYLFETTTPPANKPSFGGPSGDTSLTGDAALQAQFASKLGIKTS